MVNQWRHILPYSCNGEVTGYIIHSFFKDCGTVLKEAPPAAVREILPIASTKLESPTSYGTAQNEQVVAN